MSTYTYRTIIVPAQFQQLAQVLCEAAAEGDAGKGMFTTGLSATGALPATHYISSGYIDTPFAAALPLTVYETDEDGNEIAGTAMASYEAFVELCQTFGVEPLDVGTFVALSDAVIVTADGPQETMRRLGLRLVVPSMAD